MTPSDTELPEEEVTKEIIREIFNEGKYFERAESGELKSMMKRDSHPDPPPHDEPYCTRSQIVYYLTIENEVCAVVHQYRRPDGKIGASGRPDPKRLYLEDRTIYVRESP